MWATVKQRLYFESSENLQQIHGLVFIKNVHSAHNHLRALLNRKNLLYPEGVHAKNLKEFQLKGVETEGFH